MQNPYASPESSPSLPPVSLKGVTADATFTMHVAHLRDATRVYLNRAPHIRSLRRWGSAIILGTLLLMAIPAVIRAGLPALLACFLFAGIAVMLLNSRTMTRLMAEVTLSSVRRAPGVLGDHSVRVSENTLTESTFVAQTTWQLAFVTDIFLTQDMLIVVPTPNQIVPIPREADFAPDTFDTFCDKVLILYEQAKQNRCAGERQREAVD